MPGMDREFKKKFDTKKISPEELKMCKEEATRPPGTDQDFKKKVDTTKMSPEELKMCKEEATRPLGVDQEIKKKFDTTKMSSEELKMCNQEVARKPPGMDQDFKKSVDTTKMSPEELKMLNLEDARRPPGMGLSPGSTLYQQGGPRLSKAGRYPAVLAGVAVLTGISTFLYYRTLNVPQLQGEGNEAMVSIHPATAKTPADAPR